MSIANNNQIASLSVNAGDIIVARADTVTSRLIRLFTLSMWSHVGIAVKENLILEAVKSVGSASDSQGQVRVVPVSEFVANTSMVRHYIRPEKLSHSQLAKLQSFANSSSLNGYTSMHAFLTSTIPITRIFFILATIFSMVERWNSDPPSITHTPLFYILPPIFFVVMFAVMYFLMVWSFRCKWRVEATENIFRKYWLGKWLVETKYEMFCSKLVLLADKEVDGSLHVEAPNEDEVQPKHVARACEKLGWQFIDVP